MAGYCPWGLITWFLTPTSLGFSQLQTKLEMSAIILTDSTNKKCLLCFIIWATSWKNLFLQYANNKGADQPAHPRSLIRRSLISTFVIRCWDGIIPILAKSKISWLYLASEAEQAGLSLTWSKTLKTGFLMTRLIFKIAVCSPHDQTVG